MLLKIFLHVNLYLMLFSNGYFSLVSGSNSEDVSVKNTLVWGPGLKTDFLVPVRYFFIQVVQNNGNNSTESCGESVFTVNITPRSGDRVRIWSQVLDLHNGQYIVRYRLYSTTKDLEISVRYKDQHVADSPYFLTGSVYNENCNCPQISSEKWAENVNCPARYRQIENDLKPFPEIDMSEIAAEAVKRFNQRGRHSLCHYKIHANQVYRKCYGQHIGFKMFSDAILLSLTRKMFLPDIEFMVNLGDWPLENKSKNTVVIFSWCGSRDTKDIVMPTYDLTEATLEMMGRVTLDIFSVQANTGPKWESKTQKMFWRGRDSRQERLDLVELSRNKPNLIDAALTNMFFFPKNETKYGKIQKATSFFNFFKYKYQINVDGTVAAYRLPYLLAGDSLVLKQDSDYYEHFYNDLKPWVHYIPIKRDLSDVVDMINWAKNNDDQAREIAKNAQAFVKENLNPSDVLCYHVRLFQEYAKRLSNSVVVPNDFEKVEQPQDKGNCQCPRKHEEL